MGHAVDTTLRAIHSYLQKHESITRPEVMREAHIHENTALKYLGQFVEIRLLKVLGNGPSRAYAFADPSFRSMSADQWVAEAKKRFQRQENEEEDVDKDPDSNEPEEEPKPKGARSKTPKPKTPPPRWEQKSPVWSLTVPAGERAAVWYRTESDNLHVTLKEEDAMYVTLDPALRLKVAVNDHSRLVGFTSKPFSRLFRRRGFGPVLFADKKVTLEKLLSFIGLAVAADMTENGELNSPKAAKRLAALTEHLRAILWKLGNRSLYVADESYWDELSK